MIQLASYHRSSSSARSSSAAKHGVRLGRALFDAQHLTREYSLEPAAVDSSGPE